MTLTEAIAAAGMTPPRRIVSDRWMRFPGIGKGGSNRSGWCKLITPTLAVFGDWSSDFSGTWHDDTQVDAATAAKLLEKARAQAREYARLQRQQQSRAADKAAQMIRDATMATHPYLVRKGFPNLLGLVHADKLVIPVRDATDYSHVISVQMIGADGEKKFLTGGRTRCGVYRIGVIPGHARRVVLCEGYATGLSLYAALQRLPGPCSIIVCFSAGNLELVAEHFPAALVCADNDESKRGEQAARATGLAWCMPPDVGTDFNDMHRERGVYAVTEILRAT
jgi:putative DNA primase/helicase